MDRRHGSKNQDTNAVASGKSTPKRNSSAVAPRKDDFAREAFLQVGFQPAPDTDLTLALDTVARWIDANFDPDNRSRWRGGVGLGAGLPYLIDMNLDHALAHLKQCRDLRVTDRFEELVNVATRILMALQLYEEAKHEFKR